MTDGISHDVAETAVSSERVGDGRYSATAMALHWTLALLIVVQVGLGWWMNEALPDHSPLQTQIEAIHISLGLTILLLVLVRIAVRLIHPAPPAPAALAAWERVLARASHVLFYLLMLALPLTGWALVSLGTHPIHFWGLPWPHLPGVGAVFGSPTPKPVRQGLAHIHVYILIWLVVINLALHVAGALKHQFDGHPVLWRMAPIKPPSGGRREPL